MVSRELGYLQSYISQALREGFFPSVHLDHTHAADNLIHDLHSFIDPAGGLTSVKIKELNVRNLSVFSSPPPRVREWERGEGRERGWGGKEKEGEGERGTKRRPTSHRKGKTQTVSNCYLKFIRTSPILICIGTNNNNRPMPARDDGPICLHSNTSTTRASKGPRMM